LSEAKSDNLSNELSAFVALKQTYLTATQLAAKTTGQGEIERGCQRHPGGWLTHNLHSGIF
jgi:hypothetical protein